MQDKPLRNLRGDGERRTWQEQYVRNALATIKQIQTEDRKLAGHLLSAEQALISASVYLKEKSAAESRESECREPIGVDGKCAVCGWNTKTRSYDPVDEKV